MGAGDLAPALAHATHPGAHRPLARAPADDEQLGAVLVVDVEVGDVDAGHLGRPQRGHARVVGGVVADLAGDVLLLQAADAVRQAGRAGDRPRARAVVVARVGHETGAVARRLREGGIDGGQRRRLRDPPRLRAVGQEEVGEQDDRRAVAHGDAHRLVGGIEALARRRRGDDRHRRLAVAPVEGRQQVGLLGLGRHAGRRAGALDVDDHHRQLERDRQPDGLGLEVEPRAAGRGHAQRAPEGGAQGHAGGGDLVLGLDRAHAGGLAVGQVVQQVGGRRDRIGAEDERQPAAHAGGQQAERRGRRAVDVAIDARRHVARRADLVAHVDELGRLAEVHAGAEGGEVDVAHGGLVGELALDPALGDLGRTVVEPRDEAKGEEVARPLGVARGGALEPLDRAADDGRHRHALDLEAVERVVLERVRLVGRLLQVAGGEGVLVDDDRRAALELAEVRPQGGGVHGHEHVGRVARRGDVALGEVDLEARDAGEAAGGGADLGREARQQDSDG